MRVWRSYFEEWLKSGFAERVLLLDRGGAGPSLPDLRTRSIPPWNPEATAEDSLLLQHVCDEEGAALFVSTYYTTPIGTPSLMLVYDLIPERLGLDMSDPIWDEKRLAVEHASSYACISENTRRRCARALARGAGQARGSHSLGVSDSLRPSAEGEVDGFRREHRIERPYFLLVGDRRGVGGYKNTRLLFERCATGAGRAGTRSSASAATLVEPELRLAGPKIRVRRLSLSDEELRLAYAGAVALVYPSRYEGFGLPVAEAMACGCPVITTRLASLPEVAGDAAVYVDPDDPQLLREALDAVCDPSRRATMVATGAIQASAFRWDRASAAFATALSQAASADTAEHARARETVWTEKREAQSVHQRERRNSNLRRGIPLVGRNARAHLERRLQLAALRYLPPRAVVLLRSLKRAPD